VKFKGREESVCSIARSLLKHIPVSNLMIMDSGRRCASIVRVPVDQISEFHSFLNSKNLNETVDVLQNSRVTYFRSYRNNLYRRLRKKDGDWDDDISIILSQKGNK
jgi:hypothetical protein